MEVAEFFGKIILSLADPLALLGYIVAVLVGRASWRKATIFCCIWGALIEFTYLAMFRAEKMHYAGVGLIPRLIGACIAAGLLYWGYTALRRHMAQK
jgi:uncharacterized membrane protein YeaQ/YmgE (transglycosylase-associated protein family)